MNEQVESAKAVGLHAVAFHSDLSDKERASILEDLLKGKIDLCTFSFYIKYFAIRFRIFSIVYFAPEALASGSALLNALQSPEGLQLFHGFWVDEAILLFIN